MNPSKQFQKLTEFIAYAGSAKMRLLTQKVKGNLCTITVHTKLFSQTRGQKHKGGVNTVNNKS